APRPRLVVILGVTNAKGSFILSADAEQGFYMRDSFALASDKIAVPITFPSQSTVASAALDPKSLGATDLAALYALVKAAGSDQALAGTLVWSDAERGWIANWRLDTTGKGDQWQISGVSFDDAFRNALRGAAQVLSGNGEPGR